MRVGLLGLGHLGKIHFKCLQKTDFDLVGIYDPAYLPTAEVADYNGIRLYNNSEDLIRNSDACIIAANTEEHYNLAHQVLSQGKHCFVEKPVTSTLEQAKSLAVLIADQAHIVTQVGFVERYNPAYKYLIDYVQEPKFIEVHRLSQFNNRGNDVSVVFDLMIHDLDLLLTMKKSPIVDIRATGVKVITDSLDICNCRLEFEDGCVANITASRMSLKVMRKFRIFRENAYLSMDLHKKEGQIISLSDTEVPNALQLDVGDKKKHIVIKSSGSLEGNAILDELNDFYESIKNNKQSKANLASAIETTKLAKRIEELALETTVIS